MGKGPASPRGPILEQNHCPRAFSMEERRLGGGVRMMSELLPLKNVSSGTTAELACHCVPPNSAPHSSGPVPTDRRGEGGQSGRDKRDPLLPGCGGAVSRTNS
jgi:hypothetical protein